MNMAVEVLSASPTVKKITSAQLHAVADAFANIDSYKHFATHEMPKLISICRFRIQNLATFRNGGADIEINIADVNALSSLLRLIEDANSGGRPELILSFIESAYDLIEGMAGEQKHTIFPGDEE